MTERERSPYRSAPKAELVIEAGSSPSIFVVLVAAATLFYGLWWYLGWLEDSGWQPALLAVLVTTSVAVHTSRRNRWRFTLERRRLRVERLLPTGAAQLGMLDVSSAVKLRVDVPEKRAGIEARLTLSASGEELCFHPGGRTRLVYEELSRFLREAEIEVDAPKDLPELPGDKLDLPKM